MIDRTKTSTRPENWIDQIDQIAQWVILIILYVIFVFTYTINYPINFPPELFGHKTKAMFDLWSFQHILAGIVFGRIVCLLVEDRKEYPRDRTVYLAMFFLTIFWEWTETLMETGSFGIGIFKWKDGVEHWTNRFIADPALVLFGMYLFRKYRKYFWSALAISSLWLFINSYMPNCNSIQNYLLQIL